MAGPVYFANGGLTGTSNATTAAIAYPAGVQVGDVAYLLVHSDNNSAITGPGFPWVQVGVQVNTGTTFGAALFWRRLTGTETGTVSVTRATAGTNNWFGGTMTVYRGATPGGVPHEIPAANSGSGTAVTGVALSTTGPNRMAVQLWAFGAAVTSAPGGAYTEDWELTNAAGNDGAQAADSQAVPLPAVIAAPTRTIAANPWAVFGLAVVPASPPGLDRNHLGGAVGTTSAVAAVTPSANAWMVATVLTRRNGTTAAVTPTCVDNGGNTWTMIADGALTVANSVRLSVFKAKAKPSPGTFNVTAASATAASMAISLEQFIGSDGALANVSPVGTNPNGDPGATLATNPDAGSIVLGMFAGLGTIAPTIPAGYTEIDLQSPSGARLSVCWDHTIDFDAVWSSTDTESAACLVEVAELAPEAHASGVDFTFPSSPSARAVGGEVGRGLLIQTVIDPMAWDGAAMTWDGAPMNWGTAITATAGTFNAAGGKAVAPAGGAASFTTPASFAAQAVGGETGRAAIGLEAAPVPMTWDGASMTWGGVSMDWGTGPAFTASLHASAAGSDAAAGASGTTLPSTATAAAAGGEVARAGPGQAGVPSAVGANADQAGANQLLAAAATATAAAGRDGGVIVALAATFAAAAAEGAASGAGFSQPGAAFAAATLPARAGGAEVTFASTGFAAAAGTQARATSGSAVSTLGTTTLVAGGEQGCGGLGQQGTFSAKAGTDAGSGSSASVILAQGFAATGVAPHQSPGTVQSTAATTASAAGGEQASGGLGQQGTFSASAPKPAGAAASQGQGGIFGAAAAGGEGGAASVGQGGTSSASAGAARDIGSGTINLQSAIAGRGATGESSGVGAFGQAGGFAAAGAYGRTGTAQATLADSAAAYGGGARPGRAGATISSGFSALGVANLAFTGGSGANVTLAAASTARASGGERAGGLIDPGAAAAPDPMTWFTATNAMTWDGVPMTWDGVPMTWDDGLASALAWNGDPMAWNGDPMAWDAVFLSLPMTWDGAPMAWGVGVPTTSGIFHAVGTAGAPFAEEHASGANVLLAFAGVARAAGGGRGEGGLVQPSSFPVRAAGGEVANAATTQAAAFNAQGLGFGSDAHGSGANVLIAAGFASCAGGGEAGAASQVQAGLLSAAASYGKAGTASPTFPASTTADAADAAWSTAAVVQAQRFDAQGGGNLGYNQASDASVTIPQYFSASASAAGTVGGTLDTAAASTATAAAGHDGPVGAGLAIAGGFAADGRHGAGAGAGSATVAGGFGGVGGDAARGSGANFDFATGLAALGRIGAGSGCFVILSVAAGGGTGGAASRQGWSGPGQEGTARAGEVIGAQGAAASTIAGTLGAAFGDVARPYVQIIEADAMILTAANLNCAVRTNVVVDALVTAVERSN